MTCLEETDYGELVRCDRCEKEMDFRHTEACPLFNRESRYKDCTCGAHDRSQHECNELQGINGLWAQFFCTDRRNAISPVLPYGFPEHTCRACAITLTPIVQRFADIRLLGIYNQRLRKAINERHKQAG